MPNNRHFWAFEPHEDGSDLLRLEGPIAAESWFGDEVTPAEFRAELAQHPGDITVYINSPGGDVVAGSQIYAALREHPGRVTVRVDGLAASAASVIAMAGEHVEMAPTAYMMIHNASTVAMGDNREMRHAADMLDEINRGIREAYREKTGLGDARLTHMMDDETWMSARTALELGFIDAIAYAPEPAGDEQVSDLFARFGRRGHAPAVAFAATCPMQALTNAMARQTPKPEPTPAPVTDEEKDKARARLALAMSM